MWIVKAVGLHVESGSSPSGVSRWAIAFFLCVLVPGFEETEQDVGLVISTILDDWIEETID